MEVDHGTVAVAVIGGAGTLRRRVDLGKEEGDDHGRRGRWWAEHAGGAPEGGGGPSLRSLPGKLGGGGLDLGRRRLAAFRSLRSRSRSSRGFSPRPLEAWNVSPGKRRG